jgi:hypothetical protein
MANPLDDLARAARPSLPRPQLGAPADASGPEISPMLWGFGAMLGAAIPLFVVIVIAIITASWFDRQILKSEIRDAITAASQR